MTPLRLFISQLSNPSSKQSATYYTFDGRQFKTFTSMEEMVKDGATLISFDWDNLITWLSIREEKMPLNIVDVEQIAKQLYGHKKNVGEHLPWSIWTIVKQYYQAEENEVFVETQRVYQGLVVVENDKRDRLYFRLLKSMKKAYEDKIFELQNSGEYDRFYYIERQIRIINLERTYKGISIDTENVSFWIEQLSHDVYRLRNDLQLNYAIISAADWKTVFQKVEVKAKIPNAQQIIEEKGYYFFLKDAQKRHPLIQALYNEKKCTTDLNALLAVGALKPKYKKIHPIFDSFGTVTARTKVVTPNLQNLSKKYRSLITADFGKVLVYIDYSQFEAGILADESKDELLIRDYNDLYIYDEIGKRIQIQQYISDVEEQRKFCKSLFYKFSYGMDIKQNINILRDYQLERFENTLSPLITAAFAKYTKLNEYRDSINEQLKTESKIGTHNGNFRYQFENEKKVSWAMSQRIQGTASLILKTAIIELRHRDEDIEFLIPMHDAALFQVPRFQQEEKKEIIKEVFENAFSKECPLIKASAKFKDFYNRPNSIPSIPIEF